MAAKYKVKSKKQEGGKYKHEVEVPVVYKIDFDKNPTTAEVDAAIEAMMVKNKAIKAKLVAFLEKCKQ